MTDFGTARVCFSVAIGTANLLASFFNWYLFRHIDHRDHTDLHRMGEPVGEVKTQVEETKV